MTSKLEDVARRSGVSLTTVSHVLNGKGRVSEATRVRVLEAAEELDYVQDPVARGLASGSTGLVAITPSIPAEVSISYMEIAYFASLISAATAVVTEHGFGMVTTPVGAGPDTLERLPVDGVIVIEPQAGDPRLAAARRRGIPVVTIGRDIHEATTGGWCVDADDAAMVGRALDHLVEAGAAAPVLFSLDPFDAFTDEVANAYAAWCREADVRPQVQMADAADGADHRQRARAAAGELLDRAPAGVYCAFEYLAIELLVEARARGVRVPEDLLLVANNDLAMAAHTDPPLSTTEPNAEGLGRAAAHLLVEALTDPSAAPRTVWVETGMTIRASSTPA